MSLEDYILEEDVNTPVIQKWEGSSVRGIALRIGISGISSEISISVLTMFQKEWKTDTVESYGGLFALCSPLSHVNGSSRWWTPLLAQPFESSND